MGIERVAMLKWDVDDIRLFYENDLRFLEQFGPAELMRCREVVLSWIREFVDVPGTPEEIGARMSLRGLALEGIERHGDDAVLDFDVTANRPRLPVDFGHRARDRDRIACCRCTGSAR